MSDTGRGDTEASQEPHTGHQGAAAADSAEEARSEEAAVAPSPGEQLRRAREAQGRTARAVGTSLNLPAARVEALEQDDDASLPPSTFVRGYLRSYARLVGCDPEAIVAAYERRRGEAPDGPGAREPGRPGAALPGGQPLQRGPSGTGRRLRLLAAIAGLLVLLAAGGGWLLLLLTGNGAGEAPLPEEPASEEAAAGAADDGLPLPDEGAGEPGSATPGQGEDASSSAGSPEPVGESLELTQALPSPDELATGEQAGDAEAQAETQAGAAAEAAAADSAGRAEAAEGAGAADGEASSSAAASGEAAAGEPAASSADGTGTGEVAPGLLIRVGEGESWMEIEADGEQAFVGLVEGPDRVSLAPADRYELVIGNAHLVAVEHAGEPVELAPHIRDNGVARLALTDSE